MLVIRGSQKDGWPRIDACALVIYAKPVSERVSVEIFKCYDGAWVTGVSRDGRAVYCKEYDHLCPEPHTANGYMPWAEAKEYANNLLKALKESDFQ